MDHGAFVRARASAGSAHTLAGMAAPIPNEGAVPVDFDTPVGEVRLLIGDTDPVPGSEDATTGMGAYVFYSDVEIGVFIRSAGGARPAAAGILRAIAASTALKLKKWTSADLAVDGPAIADSLLRAAAAIDAGTAAVNAPTDQAFAAKVPVGGVSGAASIAALDGALWPYGIL